MEFVFDVQAKVRQEVVKHAKGDIPKALKQIQSPCMDYLMENAYGIFCSEITEAIKTCGFNPGILDNPRFLSMVSIRKINDWSFSINIVQDLLSFNRRGTVPMVALRDMVNIPQQQNFLLFNTKYYFEDFINQNVGNYIKKELTKGPKGSPQHKGG